MADGAFVIDGLTITKPGVRVLLPAGIIDVTAPIELRAYGLGIEGLGRNWPPGPSPYGGTILRWTGTNPAEMPLRLRGCSFPYLADFGVQMAEPAAAAIQIETLTDTTSTAGTLKRIFSHAQNNAAIGVRWCIGTKSGLPDGDGGDANNDLFTVEQVHMQNFTAAGYAIEHAQSKTHTFRESAFLSCPKGVDSAGSYRWYGGAGGGSSSIADFYASNIADNILISGVNLEGSYRLFESLSSANPWAVTIEGARWDAGGLAADDYVVRYQHRGPFNFHGNYIGAPGPGRNPKVLLTSSGPTVGSAIGNAFYWQDIPETNDPQPFVTTYHRGTWHARSNIVKGTNTPHDVYPAPDLN